MVSRALDPVVALTKLGGVATAAQLRAACDPWQIRLAVRDQRVVRAGPRRYALPGAAEAFVAAARLGGVVGVLSAALHWQWKVKTPPVCPHVIVPNWRRRPAGLREGVRPFWVDLPPEAVHDGRVTTRLQTAVDCMRRLPFDEGLCVADSALRERRLTKDQLVAAAHEAPRTGRTRAVGVAEAADGRAANPFESCVRSVCLRVPGLEVVPQYQVEDIGRADLADPRLRLAIECDSHEFHSDERAFRYDVRRYTAMVRHRWRVVRFVWEDAMARQDYVEAVLRDLVAQGPPVYGEFVTVGRDLRVTGGI